MQIEQAINSGKPNILKPRKALNKAFLKVKPNRSQIEQFKENLIQLLKQPEANTFSLKAEMDRLVSFMV